MRRFIIYYRRGRNRWRQLQPGVHDETCKRPEVQHAIRYLRGNPSAVAIAVRVDDELFNLMATDETECYEFVFPED